MSRARIGRTISITLLAGTLLAASGCLASDSEDATAAEGYEAITEAAKNEGTVTWYTSIPEAIANEAAEEFRKEHGIEVEAVVLTSGLLATRFASEMSSGGSPADVITVADPLFFQDAVAKSWIIKLSESDIPALATWPKDAFREDSYALVNIQPIGISIHSEKIDKDKVAASWEILLDPAYKGQIYLVNPTNVPNWLSHMKLMRDTYGPEFLKKLADQKPKVVDSAVPGIQQLAAGSGVMVYPGLLSVTNPLSSKGAPVTTVFPSPTTGVEQYAAVSNKAPHPNAARLFLNFLLTEQAQKILNKGAGSSPLGALEGTIPLPDQYVTPDVKAAVEIKDQILSELGLK